MKRLLAFGIAAGIALGARAQFSNNAVLYLTKNISADAIQHVEAETIGGNITVTGGAGSDARIEVYVASNSGRRISLSKDEIDARIREDYDFSVSSTDHTLSAKVHAKKRNMDWKRALNISYAIYVPSSVSTELSTSGGNIALKNLSGTQEFSTSGGNLDVEKISGNITGSTSGGNIHVSDAQDKINLSTSGGNIDAMNCSGKITLVTSGGHLRLAELKGVIDATTSGGNVEGHNISGDLTAKTSGGNVNLQELYCSLETSTSGGNINVAIKDPGKFVRINNSGGRVALEIPASKGYDLRISGGKIRTESLNNFSGSSKEDEINGKTNGGGISVDVDAGSGKVDLSFK